MVFKKIIKEFLNAGLNSVFSELKTELVGSVVYRFQEFQRQMIKQLSGIFLILVSSVFLALGAVFFLIEYLSLTKTLSFLIIGIIFLIAGITVKSMR